MTRDLRLLAGAVFLSAAGDLVALVVLALEVHALTGSGLAVSALFATTLLPMVALAPLAGLVADRCESVRVLVGASLAQAAAAAALAACSGDLAAILVLSTLLTAGNAFAQPAEFALVPAVGGAGGLARATGVVESARYAGFAAGPAAAAALAVAGPRAALLANAASFVAIAAAAGALRARRPPVAVAAAEAATRARALDGLRVLRADPVLRPALGAAVSGLLFISASLTVEIFYVKDVVGASDALYALLVGAWMVGMVAGALAVAPRVAAPAVATAAVMALGLQGCGMGVQTAWAILPVAFGGYVVGGVAHGAKNVLLRTLLATRVPSTVHGRAFAAYNAARNVAELGAVGAGGVLVGAIGPRAALLIAALGPVVAATVGLWRLRTVAPVVLRVDDRGRLWRAAVAAGRDAGGP